MVALRIVDIADDELPEVGLIVVEDAETGEQLSSTPPTRCSAAAPRRRRAREPRLAAGMRRAGVPLHGVDTDGDLVETLVEVVAETQRRRG